MKKIYAAVAAFLLALAAMLAVAAPAQATPNNCSQAYAYCAYQDVNFGTSDEWERNYVFSPGCYAAAYNDLYESFWNNSGRTVTLYKHAGCTGSNITAYHNTGWGWLGNPCGGCLLQQVSAFRVH